MSVIASSTRLATTNTEDVIDSARSVPTRALQGTLNWIDPIYTAALAENASAYSEGVSPNSRT